MNSPATPRPWPEPAASGARRSTLDTDLIVDGQIRSTGPVDVLGRVTGTITAPDVSVAQTGVVDGSILALGASITGAVTGTIEARSAQFAASAQVRADVLHETIAIEAGARIEGQLKRRA